MPIKIISGPAFLDPEVRRVLLGEIAFQRQQRDGFRAVAVDEAEPWGVRLRAKLRAEGCTGAIRALRRVWSELLGLERRHAEFELELRYAWGDR
ncbi:MAG TPA: hypothetical protein VLM76_13465 [Patescibacteria group bacterium]|nr:hypothetical protein [Patescibacteria group bacterium]